MQILTGCVLFFLVAAVALPLAACGGATPDGTAPAGTVVPEFPTELPPGFTPPVSTAIPTLPGRLGPTELKYRLLAEFPDHFYCDPDQYPVSRGDEQDLARQRFPEIQANPEEFNAILAQLNLAGQSSFTDEQILLVYRQHKRLNAIPLEPVPEGYQFQLQVAQIEGEGELVTGLIDGQGAIRVQAREPSIATCPICLAAGTLINTPGGPVAVEDLQAGMIVWTVDQAGERVARPVLRTRRTAVPASHRVVHLVLDDGRQLWASSGHPAVDGRTMGKLQAGDRLDGALVRSTRLLPYESGSTFDLLPAGETGFYWANGILIGSTLE
jgi:hypothetical protein